MVRRRPAQSQIVRARRLRRAMTPAEGILWRQLRAHRFRGVGFRRQAPIGPYIVDFAAHGAGLVIEVDGGQHAGAEADRRRDAWLTSQGYRVLRFWNNEVFENLEGVLATIDEALPPPDPSPTRGEGGARIERPGPGSDQGRVRR